MQITVRGQTFQIDEGALLMYLQSAGIRLDQRTQVREVVGNTPDAGKVLLNENIYDNPYRG